MFVTKGNSKVYKILGNQTLEQISKVTVFFSFCFCFRFSFFIIPSPLFLVFDAFPSLVLFGQKIQIINSSLYINDLLAQFLTAVMYLPILAHCFISIPPDCQGVQKWNIGLNELMTHPQFFVNYLFCVGVYLFRLYFKVAFLLNIFCKKLVEIFVDRIPIVYCLQQSVPVGKRGISDFLGDLLLKIFSRNVVLSISLN